MLVNKSFLTVFMLLFLTACSSFEVPRLSYENTKTKYITINESSYGYRRMGYGPQAPLILIQHKLSDEHILEPELIDKLAQSRVVIVFNNKRIQENSTDAQEFIRQLGFQNFEVVDFSEPNKKPQELIANLISPADWRPKNFQQ